jgi:parvulin-like peptidyl-prolyl isomerase
VKPGVFLPAFEEAVAVLTSGEISKELVETDFGYHIVKLEKRGMAKDEEGEDVETFDVRHILFATTVDDPDSIDGQPKPLTEWVKDKITTGREEARLAELAKNNPVVIEWP